MSLSALISLSLGSASTSEKHRRAILVQVLFLIVLVFLVHRCCKRNHPRPFAYFLRAIKLHRICWRRDTSLLPTFSLVPLNNGSFAWETTFSTMMRQLTNCQTIFLKTAVIFIFTFMIAPDHIIKYIHKIIK